MKRFIILFLVVLLPVCSFGQTWDQIKADTQNYLSGEGWGETIDEADQQALAAIISKLSVVVSSNFEMLEGESRSGDNAEYQRYIESKVNTYSNATLTNTEILILSNEPDAHVARWIKKSEIERIFEGRKAKVNEYIGNAIKSEEKGKVDDALRNYYWAYVLLKTLQHPSEVRYTDNRGEEHTLVSWIPERMNEIFDDIKPAIISQKGNDIELYFTFRDKPVASLDYTYFDGSRWSNIYSAKEGNGVIELSPGFAGETIQIKYEYAYKNEAHIDREISSVINVVKGSSLRKSYATLKVKVNKEVAKAAATTEKETTEAATETLTKLDDESYIRSSMDKILAAIRAKEYTPVKDLFTTEGLDIYKRLISYGNAKIVGSPTYTIYKNEDRIIVRSIPMSFSFARGVRKSFVEDIVFTFNMSGQIENLSFALDDAATRDILNKQAWPENARMSIIEFLENYKTAFALERLDYIRTIFDDNAVIIVGRVAKRAHSSPIPENNMVSLYNDKVVTRTRYSKEQYIKHLAQCFASNEFVNIRFANNDVIKAGKGGEIYGIQIKQDYYSTNYGDTGYLFLLVDINDPKAPMIKVRTWQTEPDPVDGLFDISHF
jgi:uncharacterized protein YdhG (YjbR/CyaY superfamily)